MPTSSATRRLDPFALIHDCKNLIKRTAKPTAERVLKAFSRVTLTILKDGAGREIGRWLTPLSSVQQDIVQQLELDASLYAQLEIHNTGN